MQGLGMLRLEEPPRRPGDEPGEPTGTQIACNSGRLLGELTALTSSFLSSVFYGTTVKAHFLISITLLFWLSKEKNWTPFQTYTYVLAAWKQLSREAISMELDSSKKFLTDNAANDKEVWEHFAPFYAARELILDVRQPWLLLDTTHLHKKISKREHELETAREREAYNARNLARAPKVSMNIPVL